MNTAKEDVEQLLKELSDDCTLEDIHYLYVIEKVRRGIERAETEGALSHEEVEKRLGKWIIAIDCSPEAVEDCRCTRPSGWRMSIVK